MAGDTIVALSTPPGRGALAVIRISGPESSNLAQHFCGEMPPPRYACLRMLHDESGNALDQGVLTFYPAPASATGEDVLEISCHGAPAVVQSLLRQIQNLGARPAEPGEFSRRGFEAGKCDLNQAQAIADLIAATSERAAKCAARVLKGDISQEISIILQQIVDIRVYVEGALDFPDEDVDWLAEGGVREPLDAVCDSAERLLQRAQQGRTVSAGVSLVLLGPPNAGKSSLLNHFTGDETAIVTTQAGTTRDVLVAPLQFNGIAVRLLDTAGIRDTEGEAEAEGVRRSWQMASEADLILQVFDAAVGWGQADEAITQQLPADCPALVLANKCDLLEDDASISGPQEVCRVSAKTGEGIPELTQRIGAALLLEEGLEEDEFMVSQRQYAAFSEMREALQRARQAQGGELIAEELRLAQQALSRVTGEFSNENLLGEIFSRFCIGK